MRTLCATNQRDDTGRSREADVAINESFVLFAGHLALLTVARDVDAEL